MKPENTLENKANFIMLYFNQKVLCFRNILEPIIYVGLDDQISLGKARKEDFLLLTPLSQITDEDAIECGYEDAAQLLRFKNKRTKPMFELHDYLRSKGYALPWMGLSVDELVEYGWVKLKDND
jgi:hypothetical protein